MDAAPPHNWLIVGLGNPGARYEKTRHNLGFMLIDQLARRLQTTVKREECRALVGRGVFENRTVELVKPQTFMNLSGESVACLVKKPDRAIAGLLVISDDLALPFGRIRLRPKGSHGGQNGLRSIIDCLRTADFMRLRIGIQPAHPVGSASGFVLENFSKGELAEVEQILETSADAIFEVIRHGLEKAMAQYN